jgi:hypothetical protein
MSGHLLRKLHIIGLTLLSALALAACDSGEKPAQSAANLEPSAAREQPDPIRPSDRNGKIDPCLLTQDEVEAAVGRPVLAPLEEEDAAIASCNYRDPVATASGSSYLIYRIVGLRVLVGGGSDYGSDAVVKARNAYETVKTNSTEPQSVAALGEDAYWDRYLSTLSILQGKYELKISVKADAGALDAAKTLAPKALERLP